MRERYVCPSCGLVCPVDYMPHRVDGVPCRGWEDMAHRRADQDRSKGGATP